MKSKRVFLVLCGAVGVVHCGGELNVGDTGAGAPALNRTGGTAGSEVMESGAGTAQVAAGGTSGTGGTGHVSSGSAGKAPSVRTHSGGSGPKLTTGGDEAGQSGGGQAGAGAQGGTGGQSGSGGDAGAPPAPCDCGSTVALTAVDCNDSYVYSAHLSDDGSVVLFQGYDSGDAVNPNSAGFWTVDNGTIYRVDRGALGLSADGQTALFDTNSGIPILRTLSGHETIVPLWIGSYLSRDGLTVVGLTSSSGQFATWTAAGGIVTLDFGQAGISALSETAGVLGGQLWNGSNDVPFVWDSTGSHVIGTPPGQSERGTSLGSVTVLNDDGTVAGGFMTTGVYSTTAGSVLFDLFRWTDADGPTSLGPCRILDLHGACDKSLFMSSDGSVLAFGAALQDGSTIGKAFRWTSAGSVDIDPDEYAAVRGMSADGNVIAGNLIDLDSGDITTPFVWSSTLGKQNLTDRLASAGADLHGWTLGEVTNVSRDGSVVMGSGTCNGVPALFRAKLPR